MGCQEESGDEVWSDTSKSDAIGTGRPAFVSGKLTSPYPNESEAGEITGCDADGPTPVKSETEPRKSDLWRYRGRELNLNRFLRFHPGGTPPLKNQRGRDIERSMNSSPHSSEAYYLLRDFFDGNAVIKF